MSVSRTAGQGPSARRLVFATRNPGKITELRQLVARLTGGAGDGDGDGDGPDLEVLSLDDLAERGIETPEVVEDGDTFEANAAKKAREISMATGLPALADDSGLEVDALDGAPGVYSARYAGPDATDADNNAKLLAALCDVPDDRRGARFRSCLVLADCQGALGDEVLTAEGECAGRILHEPRGTGGFGYDPLFFAPELGATFAELGVGTKNHLSHRARAMAALESRLIAYFRLANPASSG